MTQYIDKSALVAEINNCIDRCTIKKQSCPVNTQVEAICDNKIYAYKEILSLIDTPEVKEVDLDGISRHYALNNSPWDDCRDEIQDAYKAGFELGLKAQKGEQYDNTSR